MNSTTAALLAVGVAIALLLSLAGVIVAFMAWVRVPHGLARLTARVARLESLPAEWENTLSALDSMNKRAARLDRIRDRESVPSVTTEIPAPNGPRRRTVPLQEIMGARKVNDAG